MVLKNYVVLDTCNVRMEAVNNFMMTEDIVYNQVDPWK